VTSEGHGEARRLTPEGARGSPRRVPAVPIARRIEALEPLKAPTSASWLNAVEGFFAKLTRRRLKRGVLRALVDLQVAINRFLAETNSTPKPFVSTADPKRVLAAFCAADLASDDQAAPSGTKNPLSQALQRHGYRRAYSRAIISTRGGHALKKCAA
jgi:hypothetical protein